MEISLSELQQRMSALGDAPLNMFFGAGISRDPPTCGPIWSEMQAGFIDAIFDRMARERWPIAAEFAADRLLAKSLGVRPETFWRQMLLFAPENVVGDALGAAGLGPPNANHDSIAALLSSGRCRCAATTNFDEHVEPLLDDGVRVAVPTTHEDFADTVIYLKLHGTLRNSRSLSYTLEQYDSLRERNARLLGAMLPGRPLVIAGYSGYDTDVLPALQAVLSRVPWLVVVKHPGAPDSQPILQLANEDARSHVLVARCSDLFSILTDGIHMVPSTAPQQGEERAQHCYASAANQLAMECCPLSLVALFHLTAHWDMVRGMRCSLTMRSSTHATESMPLASDRFISCWHMPLHCRVQTA